MVVTFDRTIIIMNAFTMDKIQVIKDHWPLHSNHFTAAQFDQTEGKLYSTCHYISEWSYAVDNEVETKAL
jgi:hypothetical protein